ncbi:MAG: glycosyltransferase family 2 protein [Flavobacterium sp.]|nr:MAG: glycosyltransferase family 2 protein [Flavobacterium sp.]
MYLSVVICTYNPKLDILNKVLHSLQKQTLEKKNWELIVVDNNCSESLAERIDLAWHQHVRVVRETKPGLSNARICGVNNSRANLIVFVDDDNVLDENYLQVSYNFYNSHQEVGCFGGKSLPVFETVPPSWFNNAGINLGCQDYGSERYISNYAAANFTVKGYPEKAPIGTGMVIQKKAFECYLHEAANSPDRMKLGRQGKSLSSGEDNDIILTIVKNGYEIAYVPELIVHHLIPANRYSLEYLEEMAYQSNRTWVKVLEIHGINPHKRIQKWTLLPRKIKSYIVHRAWKKPLESIRWKSSCGVFTGLSEL